MNLVYNFFHIDEDAMEEIIDFIKEKNLIKPGEVIGVGVSGGIDSMCLLHFLNANKQALDIDVVAIHINHGIREESEDEARFVIQKCKEMGVRTYKFSIDSLKIAKEKHLSVETAAREGRYGVFEALVKKDIVDKIALAHHQSDQAETILMHIFRGSGLSGARGMDPIRDKIYIRPMLPVSKEEIENYATINSIEFVEDSSNKDTSYARNYLRNVVMKKILERWPNAVEAINNFAKAVCEDDDYINERLDFNSFIVDEKSVQMPCSYFSSRSSVYSRMVFQALSLIGAKKDIERKHIEMVRDLAFSENGKKIKLPNDVVVSKEYDFLTFVNAYVEKPTLSKTLQIGEFEAQNFGKIVINRVSTKKTREGNALYFDQRKVPKDARWRYREEGDVFEKFGGGTKKLKSFLIDKKIPVRLRDFIPVLASGNEVFVIAGVEVSEKVRVSEEFPTCFKLTVIK